MNVYFLLDNNFKMFDFFGERVWCDKLGCWSYLKMEWNWLVFDLSNYILGQQVYFNEFVYYLEICTLLANLLNYSHHFVIVSTVFYWFKVLLP